MASFEFLAVIVSILGLAASITYYANIMQSAEKARRRDLIFQRFQGYNLDYFRAYHQVALQTDWETPEEYMKKYSRYGDLEAASYYSYLLRVYTMAGVMYMEGIADADLIFKLYPAASLIRFWEQFEPIRQYSIKSIGHPDDYYLALDTLYREAKKRYPNTPSFKDTQSLITGE